MHFNYFITHLQTYAHIGVEEKAALKTKVKELRVSKGCTLLYPGDVCKSIYFIIEGFFRVYKDEPELDTTVNFAGKLEIVTSFFSFIHQVGGKEGIICECDAVVIRVNYQDLLDLEKFSNQFLKIELLCFQDYFIKMHEEMLVMRSANASQKYLYLNQKYQGIANLVSYKCIASYLGIAPPTLSNLLKEL